MTSMAAIGGFRKEWGHAPQLDPNMPKGGALFCGEGNGWE